MRPIADVSKIPQFGGTIYYVDGTNGSDTNTGKKPTNALATIGAAIGKLSTGDAINIFAATYTETGLDLNVNGCELWFEIGALIDVGSGTALTISGDHCKLTGDLQIDAFTGQIGILVSGDNCTINVSNGEGATILNGATGISVTGAGCYIKNAACGLQTTQGFLLSADQARLYACSTVGAGATIGFHINNSADIGVLSDCTSSGHTSAGYQIDTGSSDWTVVDCSTGGGDGRWIDVDSANIFANLSFDNLLHKSITYSTGTEHNIFEVTGAVKIKAIYGIVTTVIANTTSTIYLQAYSAGGSDDVTDAPGVDIDTAAVSSLLIRTSDSTSPLVLVGSAAPSVVESTSHKDTGPEFIINADVGDTTYIRSVLSAELASGVIHWHVNYEPLSVDGFITVV